MERVKRHARRVIDFSRSSQIATILILELILGTFIVVSSLGIFFNLAHEVAEKETIFFDSYITQFIYTFRTSFMTMVMQFFTFFGGELFLDVAIIATIIFLFKRHKMDALVFSFILILSVSLNLYLKDFYERPRPDFLPLAFEKTYSFPSGHAMNSFVFFTCVSYFIFRKMRNKNLGITLITFSILLIILIGISRVYLGVHYPSDVIAGWAAGLLVFVIVLLFEKTVLFLRLFRKYEANKKY